MNLTHPDGTNIKLNYTTLIVGASITVVLTIVFILVANNVGIKYEIRDLVAILTCGIVSTTLIYHAKNLRLNYEANKAKLDFDKWKFEQEKTMKENELKDKKIVYSFEATTFWFKSDMGRNVEISRSFLLANKISLLNGSIDEMKKLLDSDIETRKSITCVLNYFENLSLMINNKIVDEETVKLCFKTLFVDYFKLLKRFIEEIQRTSSRYLMNYEQVARKWELN